MQTPAQIAKCRGLLPDILASDLQTAEIDFAQLPIDVAVPQCGHPDEVDDEIALHPLDDAQFADELGLDVPTCNGLIDSHRRMREAATGSGSYPPGCNSDYPGVHSVSYLDESSLWPSQLRRTLTDDEFQGIIDAKVWGPSGDPNGTPFTMSQLKAEWGDKPMNEVVNDFAEEAYRRFGVILYPVNTGPDGQHNIHVTYPVISGSTIGVGWFPGADPCPGDHVNLHIDKTYQAGFQGQLGLKIHELGHTLKLPHQFSNQGSHQEPMSYSYRNHLVVGYSTGDSVFGLPKAPSVSLLTQHYGGVPVGKPWKGKFDGTTEPPTPKPLPFTISALLNTDTGVPVRGEIRVTFDGKAHDFIVAKKPGSMPVVYEVVPKPNI